MDKNTRLHNFIVIIVFLLFIGFFGIAYLVVPDREYSELENRYLAAFPEFTWNRLLSGEYMNDFDSYTADQITGKDLFVTGNVTYNRALGIRKINGVYLGKDGYLIQDYQEPDGILEQNLNSIQSFAQLHPEVNMTFLIAPNVNEIYPEQLPSYAQTYSQKEVIGRVKTIITADNMTVVDVTDSLMAQKDRNMYYKTDHHWTTLGAFIAYKELCKSMNIPSRHLDDYTEVTPDALFYGSLYSKVPIPGIKGDEITFYLNPEGKYLVSYVKEDRITDSLYDESYLMKKDKYATFFGGNYALITIDNLSKDTGAEDDHNNSRSSDPEGEILIIKDSYANALVPFLADHYERIHMIDLRYYHDDLNAYIEEHNIRQILFIHNVDFLSTDNSFIWLE